MPQVRVIPPLPEQVKKIRVAAYARVSSNSADQLNSFITQVEYYTQYIQSKYAWEFAGLYADEAVTGTATDKRTDFQRLIEDCRAGKIDRILVKSISRFARNTLDCIQTARELKLLGVAIEFEKENIDTGNMGSEMLLSILGSAAQEESLSISKNIKWSIRKRMQSGDFLTCRAPYGYILKGNTLEIFPPEAEVVHFIFCSYLAGMSLEELVHELNRRKSPKRWESKGWHVYHVRYILTNEKYVGDALVQKKFTPDELPLQLQKNIGQLPQYYIENSHPAIISRLDFDRTQQLIQEKNHTSSVRQEYPLSQRMICSDCGSVFKRRSASGTWICRKHYKDKAQCPMMPVSEADVYRAFLHLFNKLLEHQEKVFKPLISDLERLKAKKGTDERLMSIDKQMVELMRQHHTLARLRTRGCIDDSIFIERTTRISQKLNVLRSEAKQFSNKSNVDKVLEKTNYILALLEKAEPLSQFDEEIFLSMIEKIEVGQQCFSFKLLNGRLLKEDR